MIRWGAACVGPGPNSSNIARAVEAVIGRFVPGVGVAVASELLSKERDGETLIIKPRLTFGSKVA